MSLQLELKHLEGRYALARLPPGRGCPDRAAGRFAAITHAAEGTSVLCSEEAMPEGIGARRGFRGIAVVGNYAIESVGVVASAVQPLATAGISVFVYSTLETDYLFFQEGDLKRAVDALVEAGHRFTS